MATKQQKPAAPAFTSYRSLIGFLNQFRDDGHVPLRVDKSHMPKASGSVIFGHLHALKYLKLIDEGGKPLPMFEKYVMATDDERPALMREMLHAAYQFLFDDAEFDLARASSRQLEERFRSQEIQGSTVIRAISFFLGAARDAGIKLAPGLKAPAAPRTEKKQPLPKKATASTGANDSDDDQDDDEDGAAGNGTGAVMKFEIPIPFNRKVRISIPADFNEADWTLLQVMLNAYVARWKGIAAPANEAKKEGT